MPAVYQVVGFGRGDSRHLPHIFCFHQRYWTKPLRFPSLVLVKVYAVILFL